MAGHSKFKNIMYRKGAQDAKKAKILTKISREVAMAVQEGGADPAFNPRLRTALVRARTAGLPKDKIQRAMNPTSHEHHETLRYHGYGPGGVGLIVECLTDNKNRTASDIKAIFNQHNAKIQMTDHLFNHVGRMKLDARHLDQMIEIMQDIEIEENLLETENDIDYVSLFFARENFPKAQELLRTANLSLENKIELICEDMYWLPKVTRQVSTEDRAKLDSLIEDLEDHNDVHEVWSNAKQLGRS